MASDGTGRGEQWRGPPTPAWSAANPFAGSLGGKGLFPPKPPVISSLFRPERTANAEVIGISWAGLTDAESVTLEGRDHRERGGSIHPGENVSRGLDRPQLLIEGATGLRPGSSPGPRDASDLPSAAPPQPRANPGLQRRKGPLWCGPLRSWGGRPERRPTAPIRGPKKASRTPFWPGADASSEVRAPPRASAYLS